MHPRLRTACALAAVLFGAAACTSAGATEELDGLVGQPLGVAAPQLGEHDGGAYIDLTSTVGGEAAPADGGEVDDSWIIAAACPQASDADGDSGGFDVVEVGVVPLRTWEVADHSPEALATYRGTLHCSG